MTATTISKNPSMFSRLFTLKNALLITVVIGLFISGYLSYTKLAAVAPTCAAGSQFNCDGVTSSIYGYLFGIPVAYLGFLVYVIIGTLTLLETRTTFLQENGTILTFGIALFAWLFSMWLVYVQAGILQTFCSWCLGHEANFTVLFIIACVRLYHSLK